MNQFFLKKVLSLKSKLIPCMLAALSLLTLPDVCGVEANSIAARQNLVVASGRVAGNALLSLAVFSGPNGQRLDGEVAVFSIDPLDSKYFYGQVKCLSIEGNRATIVHQITYSNVSGLIGKYQILWLTDNGESVSGQPVDTLSSNGYFNSQPPCTWTPGVTAFFEGSITIKGSGR